MASHSYCPVASHSYCPMASHSYCPNGNSKYANDNIYQLTSWPSQYLVPTMGSCPLPGAGNSPAARSSKLAARRDDGR